MITGIGIDIVEIDRVQNALTKHGLRFIERICTPREASGHKMSDAAFFAGRWAAKEAISKALSCGIGSGCSFTDIEICNNSCGAPEAVLSGAAKETMHKLGGKSIKISISHERSYAAAMAIIEC